MCARLDRLRRWCARNLRLMRFSQNPLFSSVVSGIKWIGLGIVMQVSMRVAVLAVMARLVAPRDFGIIAIAFIFTSLAERLGQVGVGPAFVQRREIDACDLTTAWILSVISGCLITLALCLAAPIASHLFGEPSLNGVMVVLSIGFIVDSVGVVSDGVLQRELRFREIVKVETASFAIGLGAIGIALGYVGLGVWALVGANLSSRLIKSALLVYMKPISLRGGWSGARARELLTTGFGFSLGKVLNFLSLQGDNFVVGRMLGTEPLGMYTRAYQAMTLPAMYVGQAFERVLFPALSQRQDDVVALRRGLLSTLEISTLVALPASVGMCLLSPEIVLVLFGEAWRPVIPVLTILSCGVFFRAAYKCSDVLIRSKGDVYAYAARQVWYTAVIVVGSALGAYLSGLSGVAYAVVGGVVVNYILMTSLAGKIAHVSRAELVRCHLPGVWVAVWMGSALVFLVPALRAMGGEPLITLLLSAGLGVFVVVLAWVCGGSLCHDSHLSDLLGRLIERAKKRGLKTPHAAGSVPTR